MKVNLTMLVIFILKMRACKGICEFEGLLASCQMTLGGIPLTALARINPCHSPIDITFQVKGEPGNSNLSWRYTYVITNTAENAVITPHIMLAMSAHQVEESERLEVQAKFLLDGTGGPELDFLNTELLLPPSSECLNPVGLSTAGGGAGAGWVAGACLLGLGVAMIVIAVAVVRSKRLPRARGQGTGSDRRARGGRSLFNRRFWSSSGSTGGTVVQYVIPADTPDDLKVYISTSNGLEPAKTQGNKDLVTNNNATNKEAESVKKAGNIREEFPEGITNEGFMSEDDFSPVKMDGTAGPSGRDAATNNNVVVENKRTGAVTKNVRRNLNTTFNQVDSEFGAFSSDFVEGRSKGAIPKHAQHNSANLANQC